MSKGGRHSHHRKAKDESTLFVGVKGSKLPDYITGQHLKQHFEQFEDDIVNARVWRDKDMKSKGYAFIDFTSGAAANEAMRTLQGSFLRGKFPLNLKHARKDPAKGGARTTDSDTESVFDSDSDSTNTTLYVGVFDSKFPNYVNSGHLREHFAEFEHCIENAMIVRDMQTKQTKGYGFVTFTSHAAAKLAMKKLRSSKLHGKFKLFINFKGTKGSTSTTLSPSSSTTPSLSPSRASSTIDLSSCFSDDEMEQSGSGCTLYVSVNKSRFPNRINSRHLESHFSEFKEHIKKAMIVRDFQTKQSKGYGFVTFTSQSVAETAMKKLCGSKLDGKFSLFISVKKDDVKQRSVTSNPVEDEKVLVRLSGSTEELLYLQYRFYTLPTVASSALKKSLPAELMLRGNTLFLYGTQSAISRSTSQIHTSRLLQNLKSLAFNATWDQSFVAQLRDFILPEINQSEEDVVCIISDQCEQGPSSIAFTVQVFSHNYKTLQEAHQKLNGFIPQSKLFQLRPEYQTVPGLTDAFLSFGKNHHTRIEKNSGQGVRIHGLKSEDIQNCWTALKAFVDNNIVVTNNVSIGFWEAKYLKSKCSKFISTLEAEGCKVQLPVLTADQHLGKVKLVLTGKLNATKLAGEKIKDRCSLYIVQSVNLSCDTKYLSVWLKRWREFITEQSKTTSSVLIEFQHKPQSASNQVAEFTLVGVDSTAVAKAKNDLIQRENGSKDKLAKLDVAMKSQDFVMLSNNLKECEAKLEQSHNVLVIVELDYSKKCVQLITASNKKPILGVLQAELMSFIASKIPPATKSITKEIRFKDGVIGTLLTSKTKHLSMIERKGDALSVSVQPDQSQPNEFTLILTGGGVEVRAMELTIESIVKQLTAIVTHAQLVLGGHNISITSTDSFKSFCSQLLKELHVQCIYHPPVGGDLLRQVHLKSKAGHIVTLQAAIGQVSDERVDVIVVPAESRDKSMTNVEMNFEYFKFLQMKSPVMGEIVCIDSGSFPSRKALHVVLPIRCEQVEKQVDFVTACSKALECASSNQFGSLSFPALGVDNVHNVSPTLCVNTLLYCIDKHCLEKHTATLHTIRIVITQDLHSAFLSCFDKYSFKALQKSDAPSSSASDSQEPALPLSPPKYEWYWEDDKKQFTQYSQTISDTLTAAKRENPDKRCYFWVGGKAYLVDLSTMTQKNISSSVVRKVMCKEVPSENSTKALVQWYYRDDKKKFAAYSSADSAKIEDMYQKVSTAGKYVRIQSRIYTFDFENMKQVNFSTKYPRDIKRKETPIKESEKDEAEDELRVSQCIINLRGPVDNLQTAKQRVKDKLQSLSAFKNVPLPPTSTPSLKQKLCSIARRHSVSSSIRDDEKAKASGASNRRLSQVIRIEGAEHLVDKAVTEVQGEIIEFHSQSSSTSVAQADTPYPPEWEAQTNTSQLFKLDKYSREWIRVTSKFKETMSDADILSVQRIQNKWLWKRYCQHKDRIHEKNDGMVNEKELWHGSRKSSSDNIYNSEEGFDMRFSSEGLWGQANYFAEEASYSDKYAFQSADGTKELLLAKVLTGDSFESAPNKSLRMPPEKPSSLKTGNVQLKQLRYDSVAGTTCNCRVYMTYSNDKAYPAYLISYSTTPKLSFRQPPPPSTQMQSWLARLQSKYSGFTQ